MSISSCLSLQICTATILVDFGMSNWTCSWNACYIFSLVIFPIPCGIFIPPIPAIFKNGFYIYYYYFSYGFYYYSYNFTSSSSFSFVFSIYISTSSFSEPSVLFSSISPYYLFFFICRATTYMTSTTMTADSITPGCFMNILTQLLVT